MKLALCIITLGLVTSGCSDKVDTSQVSLPQTQISNTKLDHSPDKNYQQATFIGANIQEQQALLRSLRQQEKLSNKELRQKLLIELAVFTSSSEQSLSQLEQITNELEQLLTATPEDFEIMAALGSALSLQSIFHQKDLGKMNFLARKGMRIMDRAVKKSPENLGVRLLRGLSYANMPEFLNRANFAVKDLTLLKQYATNHPEFNQLINYHLAMAYSKNKQIAQANALWQQVVKTNNSAWTNKAQARLKEHHSGF